MSNCSVAPNTYLYDSLQIASCHPSWKFYTYDLMSLSIWKPANGWTMSFAELPLIVAHPPSLLAGSIILAGRYQMQVEPLWPPVLQAVTGYVEQELTTVACQLLSVHMDQQIQAQDRVKISMMESQVGSFPLLEALVPETSATFKHSEQLASATTKSIAVQAFSPSTPLNLMDMVDSSPMQG